MKLTVKQLQALIDNGLTDLALKHNPGASVPSATPVHGAGGIFSEPGGRGGVYSAIVQPLTWIEGLSLVRSEYANEAVEILTAQSATVGTNPTGWCGEPVTPGTLHKCKVIRTLGKMFVGGKKVESPEIGKLKDRADVERQILNFAQQGDPLLPDLLTSAGVNLRSMAAQQLLEIGIAARRAIAPVTIDGNAALASNATNKGWIKEFDGLSRLIKTGYADAASSTACPAADSLVMTWNAAIDGTVGGRQIVELLHDVYYSRMQLAQDLGFEGIAFEWVMDKRLFRNLVFLFACTYANARCADGGAGKPVSREATAIEARQSEMMQGQYLLIDGQAIPVRFTSGSEVTQSGETLTGDIFLVPLGWSGGNLTYIEYFPLDNPYLSEWNALSDSVGRQVINNGLYMLAKRSDGFCDQLIAASQMRLMLDTPMLAARVDDVQFQSYVGYRSFDPANTTYWYGGGVSSFGS